MSDSTVSKFRVVLVALAGVLLIHAIASTSVYSIEVADLGLIKVLPISYWVGLAVLGCLWHFGRKSAFYQASALMLTVSYLFVAPAIIKVPPWISQSYYPFAESRLINTSGHLVYRATAIFKSYLSWPGFLYLASALTLTTAMPDNILLKLFPVLTISIYGLLGFLILRIKLSTQYSIAGAAWFLGCFFLKQQYFGPPAIAYVFFLEIFLVLSWLFFEKGTETNTLIALLFFLFAATTMTHVLTSFIVVVVVVALYLTQKIVGFVMRPISTTSTATLAVLFSVVFLSYNMLVVSGFFDWTVRVLSSVFAGVRGLGIYREPQRIIGSLANRLSYWSSLAIVFVNGVLVFLTLLPALISSKLRASAFKKAYFVFCVILLVPLGIFAVAVEYGPHEAYQRAFMFALIPLSYLCVDLFSRRPKLLPLVLMGLLILNIPAQYGSDSYTLATETELSGAAFFALHTPQNLSCVHKHSMYIRYYDPEKNIKFLLVGGLPPTVIPNASVVTNIVSEADYVILSELQKNYYLYFLGVDPIEQVSFDRYNRIYDNLRLQTFKQANETLTP